MNSKLQYLLDQIDDVLQSALQFRQTIVRNADGFYDFSSIEAQKVITEISAVVDRISPHHSRYRFEMENALGHRAYTYHLLDNLIGILKALKSDYEKGYLQTFQELIHAEVFADFLEMASYFLEQGYKDPAAVMAGGVLEEHLRKLCLKNGLPIEDVKPTGNEPKKAGRLNDDLAGQNVYNKLDQKNVTAWLDLRNKAAHGKYGEYTKEQVELMVQGIRDFLTRHPA